MNQNRIYVLKSSNLSRSDIMGTGSITFGFKKFSDARKISDKLRSISPMERVWYTVIKPDKFVLTTASQIAKRPNMMGSGQVTMLDSDSFLSQMLEFNIVVRLIDDVTIDDTDFYTLHSETGYEPKGKTLDDHVIMLEKLVR